jgi:hypothetical protein
MRSSRSIGGGGFHKPGATSFGGVLAACSLDGWGPAAAVSMGGCALAVAMMMVMASGIGGSLGALCRFRTYMFRTAGTVRPP